MLSATLALLRDSALHPRYKTELCVHWLIHGDCTYGKERCNFAHGEDDLIALQDGSRPHIPENRATGQAFSTPAPRRTRSSRSGSAKSPEGSVSDVQEVVEALDAHSSLDMLQKLESDMTIPATASPSV